MNTRTGKTVEPAKLDPIVSELNVTPPTWPPRAPDAAPTLAASLLVDTLIPVALPTVAGPKVMPKKLTVHMPAGTTTEAVKTTEDAPIGPTFGVPPMHDALAE